MNSKLLRTIKGIFLLSLIFCASSYAQIKKITGKVTDGPYGGPIPGVNVSIKGKPSNVSTNAEGIYVIQADPAVDILVFSYIGFTRRMINIEGKATLNVALVAEDKSLDEVVVIGYGSVKKRDLTGSVTSVKADDIVRSPVSNAMEALQGRVAGLDIQRGSGQAGSNPAVLLRGNRSFLASQSPLYVIDGVPAGSIDNINPNDIESIDVLKDASSTAIYGAAGGNGVIMITTKKGIAGKVTIDVNSYYGVNGFATFPKPLMSDQWISYLNDRFAADNNGKLPNSLLDLGLSAQVRDAIDAGHWVDWVDESLSTGTQENHHLSLRGGSDKVQAFLSFGYIGEKGIYKFDKNQAYNGRAGVDIRFNKFLKAGVQTNINLSNSDATNSRINQAYSLAPVGLPYLEDGSINLYPVAGTSTVSPLANLAPGVFVNNSKNFYLTANPYVELNPIKDLSIRSNFGAVFSSSRNGKFANERSFNIATATGTTPFKEATYTTGLNQSLVWENIINYNFTVNQDHKFTLTGITSMAKNKAETSFVSGNGIDYDEYLYYNMGGAKTITGVGSTYEDGSRLSFAGRLNYNYKSKYLLTGSVRRDGVSQLVKKWSTFPSFAAAWVISEEDFMKETKSWLGNLKLRAGWGIAGTAGIPANARTTEVVTKTGTQITLGGAGILPNYVLKQTLANPELTWEKAHTTNIGIDASFFTNRIELNADWYHTQTKGVLYSRKLPFTSGGYDAKNPYLIYSNIASTDNKGLELSINTKNIENSNFQWNSAFTYTKYKEKLVNINLGNSLTPTELISEGLFLGQPLFNIYGYKKLGIWQLGEEVEAAKYGARPGDIRIATVPRDVNGVSDNGVHTYSANDRMLVGQKNPVWTMGLQNTFVYKNIDLTIYALARYGQMIDAPILGYYNRVAQPSSYNYWTPNNPTNDFPQPHQTAPGINTTVMSALSIVDGSYFKIKNITLGYSIPKAFGQKIGLSRFRVYGTAYNPFIFAKSKMLRNVDPETGGTDSFPLYKQIVFGLNASF
ncbi:TonB-dependent receptor [Pedobacter sp. MC2016-14]|uniref:SusC/RagA family TonB-linked outer membrane protein n=1 Tax=Pedobacter sp. MC2016-14 TaxID=2897327 RepID=UPI001E41D06F|nr:TonB-dependent receptor [Pedobacter sp. MC2016-14]MCD0489342.1 TonB-dependent receptor [Pedobacter sp. MC2016-14]